jgi:serine protease Do
MTKAAMAVLTAVVLFVAALVAIPTVSGQGQRDEARGRPRRMMMLDGRGSALGVSVSDAETGVIVEDVDEDGPAAKAGIRSGDTIVEFDGERVRSVRQFSRLVKETPEGRTVKATVVRNGARQTMDVTPDARAFGFSGDFVLPDIDIDLERAERAMRDLPRNFSFDFGLGGPIPSARGRLGLTLAPLTEQLATYFGAEEGVLVSSVEADSPAAKAGVKAGDVITTVNGRRVDEPHDVTGEIRELENRTIEVGIVRDRKSQTLKIEVPERPARRRGARPI